MLVSEPVGQLKLQTGVQGHAGRVGVRGSDVLVFTHQINALIVSHRQALEPKLTTENIGQNPRIHVARQAVDFIESCHHSSRLDAVDDMTEGRHIDVQKVAGSVGIGRAVAASISAGSRG